MNTWKRIVIELLIVLWLGGIYLTYSMYQEYRLVRTLTFEMACATNPVVATRLGAPCLPPANAQAPAAAQPVPAAPALTEKPEDDKKGGTK